MDQNCSEGRMKTAMRSLVRELRPVVRDSPSAERRSREVARVLADRVGREQLLTPSQRRASEEDYNQHVVHVEEDGRFSVVSLVWLPGQRTPIHDHVTWCVPAVHEGREAEVHYEGVSEGRGGDAEGPRSERVDRLVERSRSENRPGDVTALTPPGDIHRVWNPGPGKAISIHVYGADIRELGSSIRRCYSQPVTGAAETGPADGRLRVPEGAPGSDDEEAARSRSR